MGEVRVVKAIGVFSMIDSGELDWKVIAIDVEDPLVCSLHANVPHYKRNLAGLQ